MPFPGFGLFMEMHVHPYPTTTWKKNSVTVKKETGTEVEEEIINSSPNEANQRVDMLFL